MNIGHITACYTPVINGVTRMIALYQAELNRAGHTATIFTLGQPQPEPQVLFAPALPLGKTGYHITPRLPHAMQTQIAQMDVLHAHHLFMSVGFARRYARPVTPILYTNHTRYDLYTAAYLRHYLPWLSPHMATKIAQATLRWLWPRQAALADRVIAPTTAVADTMRQFGVQTPITVIPNGIQTSRFQQAEPLPRPAPPDVPLAIYVGRLASEKNLEDLITAVGQLHHQFNTPLHLWLIGDGPQRTQLQQRAHASGLTPHITFAGSVPSPEIPRYLATADLFVTPSISEVHPLTVIEATVAGLPVVAYNSPSIRDIIQHKQTGLLSPPDPAQLAQHLHQLITQPALRQHLRTAARARTAVFDIQQTVQKTIVLYEQLLD